MSKIETYTMHDMHHAVQHASGTERDINPQSIYNGRAILTRKGGRIWDEPRRLSEPQPTQLSHQQTTAIFRVLRTLTEHPEHPDGKVLAEEGIQSQTLWKAEKILFTGKADPLPQELQPSMPLERHEPTGDTRKPYVIRGHHLHYFADIDAHTPEGKAARTTDSMVESQNILLAQPDTHSQFGPWYYADTIGTTEQTHALFAKKLETNFHEFQELPDDFPLELRPAAKDAICNSCDIGDHCAIRKFPLRTTGTVEYDTSHISVFVHEAIRLGYRDDLRLIQGEAKFTNAPPETAEGIRMTAGTFKTVLAESPVRWKDLAEPVNFKLKI